jgi:hypothetical protein
MRLRETDRIRKFLVAEDGIHMETWRTMHARYRYFRSWRVVQF